MGAFFTLIGIDRIEPALALDAFQPFQADGGTPIELFACQSGAIVALIDGILHDSKSIVSALSESLGVAVVELSFADDVVWAYELYKAGKCLDRFSSRPSYFGLPPESTEADLAGSAATVAANWSGVEPDAIPRYLCNKEKLSPEQSSAKAYPDDQSEAWDAWQMSDFMKKLGLDYPVDQEGELRQPPFATMTIATAQGLAEKAKQEVLMRDAVARFKEMERL